MTTSPSPAANAGLKAREAERRAQLQKSAFSRGARPATPAASDGAKCREGVRQDGEV
jgi:hypothetical protein